MILDLIRARFSREKWLPKNAKITTFALTEDAVLVVGSLTILDGDTTLIRPIAVIAMLSA